MRIEPQQLIRLAWWSLPILPLALFFPAPTIGLITLAAASVAWPHRKLKIVLAILPACFLVAALLAQVIAGLLCLPSATLTVLAVTVVAAIYSLKRSYLHPVASLIFLAGGLGAGFLEWPFFVAGPAAAMLIFFALRKEVFRQAGRWLPLLSLTTLTLLAVNITWYAGIEQHAAEQYTAIEGIEKIFGYEDGKKVGGYSANRVRYLVPLPDGSLALGVRGGESGLLRFSEAGVTPLAGGRYATDNAVVLDDGLITGDIRAAKLYRWGGQSMRLLIEGDASPDKIGILRVIGDTLYTISANRRSVQAFDLTTLARGREYPIGLLCADMDTRGGLLYLATFVGGKAIALDPQSGQRLWETGSGGLLQQNIAASEQVVYVTSFLPGRVVKLDRADGTYLAMRKTGPGLRYCLYHEPTNTLIASDYLAGEIAFFDGDTLAPLTCVPVGRRPRWLQPDGLGGVLVTSAAGGFRLDPKKILLEVR